MPGGGVLRGLRCPIIRMPVISILGENHVVYNGKVDGPYMYKTHRSSPCNFKNI